MMLRRKKLSLMVIVIVVVIQQLQLLYLIRVLFLSPSVLVDGAMVVHAFSIIATRSTTTTTRISRTKLLSLQQLSPQQQVRTTTRTTDILSYSHHRRWKSQHQHQQQPLKSITRLWDCSGSPDGGASTDHVKNQTVTPIRISTESETEKDVVQTTTTTETTTTAAYTTEISLVESLQHENDVLRDIVRRLELENERLKDLPNRIVIETFEGEGKLYKQQKRRLEEIRKSNYDTYYPLEELHVFDSTKDHHEQHASDPEPSTAASTALTATPTKVEIAAKQQQQLSPTTSLTMEQQSSPLNDNDMALWCDELEQDDDVCPVEPTISFREALRDRAYWLVGLLVLQSLSGLILSRHESLLSRHPFIVYFLTMLVGAGGNAGNQASVRVIRGLALGTLNDKTQGQFLMREIKMAMALSSILSLAGFVRAIVFRTPLAETLAVTCALAMIVFTSIGLGAILPILLQRLGVDPAHSSTTIQVIMDILGVVLTVAVSSAILDSSLGQYMLAVLNVS